MTALWNLEPEALADKVETIRQSAVSSADRPAYGIWRDRITSDFAASLNG